jgi:hypothetical protein
MRPSIRELARYEDFQQLHRERTIFADDFESFFKTASEARLYRDINERFPVMTVNSQPSEINTRLADGVCERSSMTSYVLLFLQDDLADALVRRASRDDVRYIRWNHVTGQVVTSLGDDRVHAPLIEFTDSGEYLGDEPCDGDAGWEPGPWWVGDDWLMPASSESPALTYALPAGGFNSIQFDMRTAERGNASAWLLRSLEELEKPDGRA